MSKLRRLSGHELVKVLCNRFGFYVSGRSGSHVRLAKEIPGGKIGAVVPMHPDLKTGTLKGILRQARISEEELTSVL